VRLFTSRASCGKTKKFAHRLIRGIRKIKSLSITMQNILSSSTHRHPVHLPVELNITKTVSGGQTGADRAALDWAIAHGISHGGWCPKGRRAEDGIIAHCYQLVEAPSIDCRQRTEWNARDSDGTVIFTIGAVLTGGSQKTADFARKLGRPWLHVSETVHRNAPNLLRQFLREHKISVLNVAGSRGSKEPGISSFVTATLNQALRAKGQRKGN